MSTVLRSVLGVPFCCFPCFKRKMNKTGSNLGFGDLCGSEGPNCPLSIFTGQSTRYDRNSKVLLSNCNKVLNFSPWEFGEISKQYPQLTLSLRSLLIDASFLNRPVRLAIDNTCFEIKISGLVSHMSRAKRLFNQILELFVYIFCRKCSILSSRSDVKIF